MIAFIALIIFFAVIFFLWKRFADKESKKNFGFLGKLLFILVIVLIGGLAILGAMVGK